MSSNNGIPCIFQCGRTNPFVVLLTPTTTRDAYTLDDLRLVIRWVLATWNRRGAGLPKPANICRVNRFDGYIADAEKWAITEANIDPKAESLFQSFPKEQIGTITTIEHPFPE